MVNNADPQPLSYQDSQLSAENAAFIESLYEQYLVSPQSVSTQWRSYFDQIATQHQDRIPDQPRSNIQEQFLLLARNSTRNVPIAQSSVSTEHERRQVAVLQLIAAYRNRGHQKAQLDPLNLAVRQSVPDLDLATHGLSMSDLDTVFQTGNLAIGKTETTLAEMVEAMEAIYCRSVGAEYMHIVDTREKRWIQQYLESSRGVPQFQIDTRIGILERLTAAEGLEKYLGRKYVGAKRFGLEGGESFIPMMNELLQRSGASGTLEVVVGMAHRGRLNVLVNIMGKNPADLFGEFEGKTFFKRGSGDVKYHQGFSCNVMTPGGEIHVALAFNPSHLEIVNPVVEGSVRARQVRRGDVGGLQVLPILIHGDAAFAGQGVVMETFQMSQTRGFTVGGTVHIVINNQVGFTTSNPQDARSTEYCTDIAKMVQAPIFHVNGDDPEAVVFAAQLALDFRNEFKKDVVIDLFCYRRRGHNEADEPSVTQPVMYQLIEQLPSTRTLYADKLIQEQVLTRADIDKMVDDYRQALEQGQHVANALVKEPNRKMFVDWSPYLGHEVVNEWDTSVPLEKLKIYAAQLNDFPMEFEINRQVKKTLEERFLMQSGEKPLNWGAAETLAYASLIAEDIMVRLTGQDVGRGTFSHRHAEVFDAKTGDMHVPLAHIRPDVRFDIFDSLLSEEAVLAFEYGYATTIPKSLVIWEAQFGDFVNGAQVVIDQFITSGESKWERVCGLTLLLPHGFEGQGPEHSSARLERFLQLCAEDNIQVCVPSTPAQIFHVLRRQAVRPLRKPLVVISPKSLLRHKLAVSDIGELTSGGFQTVIDELSVAADKVTRIVLCGGKVYYDLLEKREELGLDHVAIIRIEQLYPFPDERLKHILGRYTQCSQLVWCQEESKNQGAWTFIASYLHALVTDMKREKPLPLFCASRVASAAPAGGSLYKHVQEQEQIVSLALGVNQKKSGE